MGLCLRGRTRLLALAVLLLTSQGCKGTATVDAKVVEATQKRYVIQVKTMPGLEAEAAGLKGTANDQGIARIELPLDRIQFMKNSVHLTVRVSGRSGLKKYFGTTDIELPFSPAEAAKQPAEKHWIRIVGGEGGVSGGTLWSFGKAGGALMRSDGSITVKLRAPGKSTVTLAGKSVTVDAMGNGKLAFSSKETLALIPSGALGVGYGQAELIAVEASVALAGDAAHKVPLKAKWNSVSGKILRPALEKLQTAPWGGTMAAEPLAVYLDSQDGLSATGRKGRLSTLDIVAIGKAQPKRKLSDCDGYQLVKKGKPVGGTFALSRVAIDEEVVVFDAHTGKERAKKLFKAQDICPVTKRREDKSLTTYPNRAKVLAWVAQHK